LEDYKRKLKNNGFDLSSNKLVQTTKTIWADEIILGDIHQVVIHKVENLKQIFQNIK